MNKETSKAYPGTEVLEKEVADAIKKFEKQNPGIEIAHLLFTRHGEHIELYPLFNSNF